MQFVTALAITLWSRRAGPKDATCRLLMAAVRAGLDSSESDRADDRRALGAHIIYESIKRDGEDELARSTRGLAWSGLAAGMSMGICLLADGVLQAHLPAAEWRPLVSKFGYALGFVVVILGRQQLFTENTLTPIIPLLDRRSRVRIGDVARLWLTVLLANLAGAAFFAIATAHAPVFSDAVHAAMLRISTAAFAHPATYQFVSGIYAGWLLALIVWLLPAADAARLWIVLVLAYLIGIGGFAHVIAGAVEVFYLTALGSATIGGAFASYILPTLLGNIAGGVGLVALLNYAQVAAGRTHQRGKR